MKLRTKIIKINSDYIITENNEGMITFSMSEEFARRCDLNMFKKALRNYLKKR